MKNPFRTKNQELTDEQMGIMDDLLDEYAEVHDVLTKLETFADPRLLAIARTRLEESMLWASQAASKGEIK